MDPNNPFFDHIEKKTNVKKEDIFSLANSIANANFQDENTVRGIVHRVAKMANVDVSKEKEDKIVKAIVKNNIPLNFSSLSKMFEQK
ncbi:MAG TPA: stage VI sporulation protein F [Candidatus Angelobacter sp.]|nr:stage VI sporulation protein F [Candidatus Angelobacter sp.]